MTHAGLLYVTLALLTAAPLVDGQSAEAAAQRYSWIVEQYARGDAASQAFSPLKQQEREWGATNEIRKEWSATTHALTWVLEKSQSSQVKVQVAGLLGEMRDEEAVWPLIRDITLDQGFPREDPLSLYPAAGALVEIGHPAVRAILRDRMQAPANEHELKLFAAVVYRHYGMEPEVGRFHVELMLKKAQEELDREGGGKSSRAATWHENLTRMLEFYNAAQRGHSILPPAGNEKEKSGDREKGGGSSN